MSDFSSTEYKTSKASNQQPSGGHSTSADSRLLDAAETLVTLQSVSSRGQGVRTRGGSLNSGGEKSRAVYLTPHSTLPRSDRMAPQPPISATTSAMGPPPPPAQSGVTYVVINQSSNSSMKPPSEPVPKRGRGRGRGRGSSTCAEPRGRGRGRGRGAASRASIPPPPVINDALEEQDDIEMTDSELGKEMPKEDTTFMVGNFELKDSIFDDLLNRKKLELIMDPEVMSIFANHQKNIRNSSQSTK